MPTTAALVLLVLAACDGATADDSAADDGPAPTLSIVEPVDGAEVCSTSFHVVLDIQNLTLVDPYDPPDPLPPGSGHVDVMLNGVDVEMTQAEELDITTAMDGFEYQLKAELSNADHTPIEPYAGDFLYITALASACSS